MDKRLGTIQMVIQIITTYTWSIYFWIIIKMQSKKLKQKNFFFITSQESVDTTLEKATVIVGIGVSLFAHRHSAHIHPPSTSLPQYLSLSPPCFSLLNTKHIHM